MLVVSQNINIFNPSVYQAIMNKDGGFIKKLGQSLLDNGADCLEINLGGWRASGQALPWIVEELRSLTDCPLFLSPIPATLKEAVDLAGGESYINCVPADDHRLESMLNAASCLKAGIVVLLTRTGFCPSSLDEMCLLAEHVIEKAEERSFPLDKLILDPVLRPRLSLDANGHMVNRPDVTFFAEAIYLIGRLRDKGIRTAAGVGNLTIGMPRDQRKRLELSAIEIFRMAGLDYVIMDCSNSTTVSRVKEGRVPFTIAPVQLEQPIKEAETSLAVNR